MKHMANIDILPMACVGLILVLVMMVVAPLVMTHTQTRVDVPRAHTAETKTEENLTITYTVDGRLLVNDSEVTPEEFSDIVATEIEKDPYQLVILRADKNVLHRDVLEILSKVKQVGAKRIACATKKPKGE
ncbi:MAG TPA: biopolymer transporter ExbD [candidate division WOR-3 bacterium]|uniref:Biopolymer transporter ExbD n=1 Tax=candidate division WOR-3 bacterium TaxID=2052148 RepID=A0A9C9EMW3_UNCW3|nr:biopolymer transporter ExbD [candidate division WOR-3 bacterium]